MFWKNISIYGQSPLLFSSIKDDGKIFDAVLVLGFITDNCKIIAMINRICKLI